jgi:hypothetical protein
MYVLIKIGTNDSRSSEFASKTKKKLENHIKDKGYYWSKKVGRYIDDKNCDGSGADYIIDEIDEL